MKQKFEIKVSEHVNIDKKKQEEEVSSPEMRENIDVIKNVTKWATRTRRSPDLQDVDSEFVFAKVEDNSHFYKYKSRDLFVKHTPTAGELLPTKNRYFVEIKY